MSDEPDGLPPSPVTALGKMAAEQHEMFMAWVTAGFTRAEALELLKHQQSLAASMAVLAAAQAEGGESG